MVRAAPLLLLLAAGCAASSPSVIATRAEGGFGLLQLRGQRVAIWPIARLEADPAAAAGVARRFPAQARFLELTSARLSERVLQVCSPGSLASWQVAGLLSATPELGPLLAPEAAPGTLAEAGSQSPAPLPDLGPLRGLPALKDVRYAVLPRTLELSLGALVVGEGTATRRLDAPTPAPRDPATGQWIIPGSGVGPAAGPVGGPAAGPMAGPTSYPVTKVRLDFAVVELPSGKVVWEGALLTDAPVVSMFNPVDAELVQAKLVERFMRALGVEPEPDAP